MRSSSTMTSISPVSRFGLTISGGLRFTRPRTAMTYSSRSTPALMCMSGLVSGLKTTWVSPSRSLRSTKMRPPWSRRRWTQPMSTTSAPLAAALISLQEWLRVRPSSESNTLFFLLPRHFASGWTYVSALNPPSVKGGLGGIL